MPDSRPAAAHPLRRVASFAVPVLLLVYPLLTQLAVYLHSLLLTAVAALLLVLAVLKVPLAAGRPWAWCALLAAVGLLGGLSWSTGRHDALFVLYAAPVLIYLFLAWFFGRTLLSGQRPLITQFAALMHGEDVLDQPGLRRYTRGLTAVWTLLFVLIAATNATLALLASPNGIIELLGGRSPWPLSPSLWSLFANVFSFALVMLLFGVEFGWRRRRFPEQHSRYRGLLDFLADLRRAAPAMGPRAATADAVTAESDDAPVRLRIRPARRGVTLTVVVLAHLSGFALILIGAWGAGAAVIVASHLLLLWGTLAPGSALFGPVVREFGTPRREVWLTIDDGPSADTAAILDLLDMHAARATFFVVGERAAAAPDAVRDIAARGHAIGNHSDGHDAAWFWATGPAAMRREIAGAQATLQDVLGQPPRLFRAVVGMANLFVEPALRRHGLLRVGWTARGFDGVVADPARVWARLQRRLRPGAILVLHEGAAHGASTAVVAHVLQRLGERGYRCVLPEVASGRSATTSQLLNGVRPHSGLNRTASPDSPSSAASASRSG